MATLAWMAAGLVVGLFAGRALHLPLGPALLLLAAALSGHALARLVHAPIALPLLVMAALLAGTARIAVVPEAPPGDLVSLHGKRVDLRAVVAGDPEPVAGGLRLRLDARDASVNGGPRRIATGVAQVWTVGFPAAPPDRRYPYIEPGDTILVRARLQAPETFDGFDYPAYLQAQGIGTVAYRAEVAAVERTGGGWRSQVANLRRRLSSAILASVPQPQASVTQALLLNMRGGVPNELADAFTRSGTVHLLAISGMHVGVLLGLALALSRWLLGRRRGLYLIPPATLIWAYVVLAGMPPSAVRATIMGTAYLVALAMGRQRHAVNALRLAELAMLLWNPRMAWQVSFQLSFAAMADILLVGLLLWNRARPAMPRAKRLPLVGRLAASIAGGTLLSLGAVLGSLPIVMFQFGAVPLVGIPATMLALPAMTLMLAGGLANAIFGAIAPPLGWVAGLVPSAAGWYFVGVARLFGGLPWASLDTPAPSAFAMWSAYVLLLALVALANRRRWWPDLAAGFAGVWAAGADSRQRALVLTVLAIVAAIPWALAFREG
ncbi:MAG: ComEC family competence protein [SAR202 cluster bacterium]|nr:ComEC family competence protein [SAR202 cluster bacterium]